MADIFGLRTEADAYRVTLWMREAPHEMAHKIILRVGDDASVSFAKEWIHESQPDTGFWYLTYDHWMVEKFYSDHIYRPIATGIAERECRRKNESLRSFRRRLENKASATAIRNGLREGHPSLPQSHSRGSGRMASGKRTAKRPARKVESYLQKRVREMKEQALRELRERG